MEESAVKRQGKSITRGLAWLVLAAAFALSVGFYARCGAHNLTADDSSEMVMAAQLNEEGKLLSENWLYSTELRVISPTPAYQLGLRLFGSWHAARTFAVAVVGLLVIASCLFMMRQLGLWQAAPWFAAVLALPFSNAYAYIVLYGCYYAVHVALSFVMVGLAARYARRGLAKGALSLLALAALGFVSGLGGVRMLTMLIAPLAAASALLGVWALRDSERLTDAAHTPYTRMAAAAWTAALTGAAGYAVNMLVLAGKYRYHTYSSLQLGAFELEDFLHQVSGVVRDLGYRANEAFFSLGGVASFVTLGLCLLLAFAALRLLARWRETPPAVRLLLTTALVAIALGMALNVLLGQILTRYFIVGTLLLVAALFAWLQTEACRCRGLRTLAMAAVVCCFAFQAQCVMRYDYTLGKVNYEMAADWLLERGYTQGYATFWNANTLTEASDGQIEMWVLEDGRRDLWMNLELHDILQSREHYTRDPEGKVFLLVTEEEDKTIAPLLDKAHIIGENIAWSYTIYGYESVEEMRSLIASGAQP